MSFLATRLGEVSAVHALGLVIGARYGLPHGIPHAILLGPALGAFLPLIGAGAQPALAALAGEEGEADDPARLVAALMEELGAEARLRAYGVPRDDLPAIADEAVGHVMMANTPRPVAAAELLDWLATVW
jgi:alcohol dehydrogenase class IV